MTGRSKTRCTSTIGRGAEVAEPVLVGHRAGRQDAAGDIVGDGANHRVGAQGPVARCGPETVAAAASGPVALDPLDLDAQAHLDAGLRQGRRRPARRAAGRAAPGSTRCRRRRLSVSRPVWNTLAAMASDASAAGRLTVGTVIRSQRAATAPGDWPCRASQAPKRLLVQGRIAAGPGARNDQHRPPQAQTVPDGQVRDSAAASRPGAAGRAGPERRSRPSRAGPPGRGGRGHHRDVEAVGQLDVCRGPDAVQERQVLVAAAQEHVLAVVDPAAAVPEGPGETAEAVAPFEQRHPGAPVGAVQGGGQPGQAAADHHDLPVPGRARLPVTPRPPTRARTATAAFSGPDNDIRPRSTPAGSRWMRTRSRR